jgi:prepilin-type N-terminal cleavage/methylation domain-containing protein
MVKYNSPDANNGFSLIELSVVLIIISLVIGGTLAGRAVVEGAQIRATVADITKHKAAISQFQSKYYALPGDMKTATDFWSASANGDGDGLIASGEMFRAWEQLSLSGLIPGSYTGTATSSVGVAKVNEPSSQMPGGIFFLLSASSVVYSSTVSETLSSNKNFLWLGKSNATNYGDDLLLTPAQALEIDKKIDDGLPTGTIRGVRSGSTAACAVGASLGALAYDSSVTTKNCILAIELE